MIFVELLTRKPMIQGTSDIDQLHRIFRIFGTPTEAVWAGVTGIKGYSSRFRYFQSCFNFEFFQQNYGICEQGFDLLEQMLRYKPDERISAKVALSHPYFDELYDLYEHNCEAAT